MNTKRKHPCIWFLTLIFLSSCGSVSPVINQYEKAGTLKKGNFELMGNFTGHSVSGNENYANINNNYGFRAGYGITDKMDIKFRFEHLMPSPMFEDENPRPVNYISIIPKFALFKDMFALVVPVSHYYTTGKKDLADDEGYDFSSVTPQFIYTFTNAKNTIDFSPSLKADILFTNEGGGVFFGGSLGAGFSPDLNKWAIRPEVGILTIGGGSFLSYGIGLQFLIHKKQK